MPEQISWTARTKREKQVVKQFGAVWTIVARSVRGPVLIRSETVEGQSDLRWITEDQIYVTR